MKTWKIIFMITAISIAGCAAFEQPRVNTSSKTNVALLQYDKIAVIKFQNPENEPSGQEAADILALGFVKQGYNVVDSSQVTGLIEQENLHMFGLTPGIKTRLKAAGIDSIVTGTVNEYFCSLTDMPPLLGRLEEKNRCRVTVTARLLDLETGEIVWGTTASDEKNGKWVTADAVLRSVMQQIQTTIPNLIALKSATAPPVRK